MSSLHSRTTKTFGCGFVNITWETFTNAVSRTAWWLLDNLGAPRQVFETIGYIGEADIRYFVLILAANKTGHKVTSDNPKLLVHF